jgi:hypothetical protein
MVVNNAVSAGIGECLRGIRALRTLADADARTGFVPLVGDIALAIWRANSRNVSLAMRCHCFATADASLASGKAAGRVPARQGRGAHSRRPARPDHRAAAAPRCALQGWWHCAGAAPRAGIGQGVRQEQQLEQPTAGRRSGGRTQVSCHPSPCRLLLSAYPGLRRVASPRTLLLNRSALDNRRCSMIYLSLGIRCQKRRSAARRDSALMWKTVT